MKSKTTQARVSGTLFGKFFVDGQWKVIEKKCATCCYVQHFDKRPDEPSNMGCTKPGWEGYTNADEMACGGCFYFPKTTKLSFAMNERKLERLVRRSQSKGQRP